jgi:hypothetical protein
VTFLSQRLVDFIRGSWEYQRIMGVPEELGVSDEHGRDAL